MIQYVILFKHEQRHFVAINTKQIIYCLKRNNLPNNI